MGYLLNDCIVKWEAWVIRIHWNELLCTYQDMKLGRGGWHKHTWCWSQGPDLSHRHFWLFWTNTFWHKCATGMDFWQYHKWWVGILTGKISLSDILMCLHPPLPGFILTGAFQEVIHVKYGHLGTLQCYLLFTTFLSCVDSIIFILKFNSFILKLNFFHIFHTVNFKIQQSVFMLVLWGLIWTCLWN